MSIPPKRTSKNPPRLRHRVEHTKNKHSRAVCKDDTIVIRLARNLSKTEEQEHIKNLLKRMTQLVSEERQKESIHPFQNLLMGGQTQTVALATGKKYVFSLYPSTKTEARRTATGWKVGVGPGTRRRALHRFLWSLLSKAEEKRITALVHGINDATYCAIIRDVELGFATTQWGSCSSRGRIMLNTALLFLPPSLLRYVIIHELAHRRYQNHSRAYWREVESILPNYEKYCEELKEFRLPTL